MERIPFALVGCGAMGRRHIRGLAALREVGLLDLGLAAVCDLDRTAATNAADDAERLLGIRPRILPDLDAVLRDDSIVALDVVTEPASHHRIAVPALLAGRHVLCEKPLSVTLRGCRAITDAHAAAPSGTILAVEEQYRRGPVDRIARAAIAAGMLGEVFLLSTIWAGGDDRILLTPWRHLREKGAIALDVGVHLADVQHYLLGSEFTDVWGRAFIAEPVRRRGEAQIAQDLYGEALARGPESIRATGEDSVIALYRMDGGATAFLTWLPSGPGHLYLERTIHGRGGSMVMPGERSGHDLVLRTGSSVMGARELLGELAGPVLDEVTTRLFPEPVHPDRPFAAIDAAHLGVTLHDFARSILDARPPEVDGRTATVAVGAILGVMESQALGRPVTREELLYGTVSVAQRDIDQAIGLA